jgi:hypothetical protein
VVRHDPDDLVVDDTAVAFLLDPVAVGALGSPTVELAVVHGVDEHQLVVVGQLQCVLDRSVVGPDLGQTHQSFRELQHEGAFGIRGGAKQRGDIEPVADGDHVTQVMGQAEGLQPAGRGERDDRSRLTRPELVVAAE